MIETDSKKQIDAEWHRLYNLSSKQLEQLIAEKFERARMYREALREREIAQEQL